MQAEKALRDAGWVEALYGDLGKDDEFFHVPTGSLLVGTRRILNSGDRVLRAPRPEPEYEPGTVVWADTSDGKQSLIAVGLPGAMRWIGKAENGIGAVYPQGVEVLRVLVYPDGSTPWIKPMGNQVDQIKVIDESGYGYVNTSARDVEYAFEDDGKTLEVFTGGTGSTHRPGDSFVQCVTDIDAINERADARARELLERLWGKLDGKDDAE